ncbi:MAG: translocation/assembly module TamB domain-containing protein [Prevotella sp.]|nr:translocation/assembly module TamB domain-containing protein [Prevotella sp.]
MSYFCTVLDKLKNIIRGVIWTLVGLSVALLVLPQVPVVQDYLGSKVSAALSDKLGTDVSVGRVVVGIPNRVIIDDVDLDDQSGQRMLHAARMSVKIDLIDLVQGKVSIPSAQLFGLIANLYKEREDTVPNFQFVIDALSSKDTTSHKPLDLSIGSLIIRHGQVRYNRLDAPLSPAGFTVDHINATDISTHIILNKLADDSLNVKVKKLSFKEEAGLKVVHLAFKAIVNRQGATLEDFRLRLPSSDLLLGKTTARYQVDGDSLLLPSLSFDGKVITSVFTPADVSCFVPSLRNFKNPVTLRAVFSGTSSLLDIDDVMISSPKGTIGLLADATISDWMGNPHWEANVKNLKLSEDGIKFVADNLGSDMEIPAVVTRLGNVHYVGALGGHGDNLHSEGQLMTGAGDATLSVVKDGPRFVGRVETAGVNLRQMLDDDKFGQIATQINIDGALRKGSLPYIKAKGEVSRFDYNAYTFNNIDIDGTFDEGVFDGTLDIDDPNAIVNLSGRMDLLGKTRSADFNAQVRRLNPSALGVSDRWPNTSFDFDVVANFVGNTINTAKGSFDINDFAMVSDDIDYRMNALHIEGGKDDNGHFLQMDSDFGHFDIQGSYDYSTLAQSITNLIGNKLPTLPGLPARTKEQNNNFAINATLTRSDWLQNLLGVPLDLHAPLHLQGTMSDREHRLDMIATLDDFAYEGSRYENARLSVATPNDTLRAKARIDKVDDKGSRLSLNVLADAIDNTFSTIIDFNNTQGKAPIRGKLDVDANFFTSPEGDNVAHVDVHPSEILVGDTLWEVHPSNVVYRKNALMVDHFAVQHDRQHIIIDGMATANMSDTLFVDLKDVDVSYILNIVDFHAVEFSGWATGKAFVSNAFGKPEAAAHLLVNDFRLENGRLGVLTADAFLNNEEQQIDIEAIANDGEGVFTTVEGLVSPQRDYIDLHISPHNTRMEFLESFCESFMKDVEARGSGDLQLYGDLDSINLIGSAVVDGNLSITPLNTTYTLKNDTIVLIPNEIVFKRDTIYDRDGHVGILTGSLYHDYLTNLSYDINVNANQLLSYDFTDFGDDTFCGTVYGTGNCRISGGNGEVTIDVDITPNQGSQIVYNVASPDAISNQEFVHWVTRGDTLDVSGISNAFANRSGGGTGDDDIDIPTDIHINFIINATPQATLKLIMDQQSGDYISLNGNGGIRATYYNKGSFEMYGNYLVEGGVYKLTIQNVIKKEFQFQPGGIIAFGGDPYQADLNLQALYTVNGVSLSDLSIGKSFTSNNIRVDCLMNITGTPNTPKIEFDLDMPTVGNDAKQMIYSVINGNEERNQQVLYLLAIGRFYNQEANNATAESAGPYSQTSLAMQSILSGTISQQLNNVLSSFIKNNNWNIGANISTGDEGFNNAEYEGLLSGRLLNNRLLINGQFGYRDNVNATSSFIGDFDIRYLLYPNGNLAIKVYNQTNDRYFTRNSLTTQGVGLIMKKDFNGLRDLFGGKKRKKAVDKK